MNLYLVRHGEALSLEENTARPLSERGISAITKVGHLLAKNSDHPINALYHSRKLRSEQSAQLISSLIPQSPEPQLLPCLEPENNVKALVNWIEDQTQSVLLVGHLPNFDLVSNFLLTGLYEKTTLSFLPGSIACFRREGDFWVLEWLIDPSLL